jgi:hypothetical protein
MASDSDPRPVGLGRRHRVCVRTSSVCQKRDFRDTHFKLLIYNTFIQVCVRCVVCVSIFLLILYTHTLFYFYFPF